MDPAANCSSTVADLVRRSAARAPGRVALRYRERTWSYAELDRAAGRVAARLRALGLAPGERVAAFGRNSDAYLLLFLGCARAGLVHVPLNYRLSPAELGALTTQAGASALLADADLPTAGAAVDVAHRGTLHGGDGGGDVLAWARAVGADADAGAGDEPAPPVAVADDDVVQLLFTSGTTAAPKAAVMTHRGQLHAYLSTIVAMDQTERDVVLHALPLYHSAQLHALLMPFLAVGAVNRLLDEPDPAEILRRIERERVTAFFAPPTVWIALGDHPDFRTRDLSSLRKAYYGASIMPVPVLRRLQQALPQVGFYNCFGQSEAGPLTTVLRPEEHAERPDSAGRPVLFVELRVVDEQLADVAPGEVGEALYRSPQLCRGYWQDPAATAQAFAGGWFRSGDLVVRDGDGYVRVVDRVKDVINTGGVLVSSREVEEALYAHPAVAEVAVVGLPDERWIEAVTAVVVTRAPVGEAELIAHARERLSGFKAPKAVRFLPELPKNAAGKVLKRALRDALAGTAAEERLQT